MSPLRWFALLVMIAHHAAQADFGNGGCDEATLNALVQAQPAGDGLHGALTALADSDVFRRECWEKYPVHLKKVPDLAGLVDESELHDLIVDELTVATTMPEYSATGDITWGEDRAKPKKGTQLEPNALQAIWDRAATLVVHCAGLVLPGVTQACLQVSSIFGFPTNANLYVTGPGAKVGTPVHNDAHDVLVLHIQGRKQWAVYPPRYPLPYRNQEVGKAGNVVAAWEKQPSRELVMEPGDVLYIPRGWLHETSTAASGDTVSMHSTIALAADEVSCTWWQMLWCAAINAVFGSKEGNELVTSGAIDKEAAADVMNPKGSYFTAARENTTHGASMRRAIPFGFLQKDSDPAQLVENVQVDMERLASDAELHVGAIKPLLGLDSYAHAVLHFGKQHTGTVQRYMDAYLGFLGEPSTAVGEPFYDEKGGMHLEQMEKQGRAESIISNLNLEAFDGLMQGCMGGGASLLDKAAQEDEGEEDL